jgi:hypothetical protein
MGFRQVSNHFQIANTMKKSDHLWLKLASKWATDEPSTTTAKTTPVTASTQNKTLTPSQEKRGQHDSWNQTNLTLKSFLALL